MKRELAQRQRIKDTNFIPFASVWLPLALPLVCVYAAHHFMFGFEKAGRKIHNVTVSAVWTLRKLYFVLQRTLNPNERQIICRENAHGLSVKIDSTNRKDHLKFKNCALIINDAKWNVVVDFSIFDFRKTKMQTISAHISCFQRLIQRWDTLKYTVCAFAQGNPHNKASIQFINLLNVWVRVRVCSVRAI